MKTGLNIAKLSKKDKILILEFMKEFVGNDAPGELAGYCGLCSATFAAVLLLFHTLTRSKSTLKVLGITRPLNTDSIYWFPTTPEGTAKRLALIDEAIEKLKH